MTLEVIFEDDTLAVINKPAGILVSGNKFMTVANALRQNLKISSETDAVKPQPVHRLDYGTTGVLLVGKTISGIRELNRLFLDKKIEKTYFAIAIGKMNKQGIITSNIDAKSAFTEYKVLQSVDSRRFGQLNLVCLKPQTGRRHQIRKHLAAIGHPILGDKDYGIDGLILKGKGIYLHAYSVEFRHPKNKEEMKLVVELPSKYSRVFKLSFLLFF